MITLRLFVISAAVAIFAVSCTDSNSGNGKAENMAQENSSQTEASPAETPANELASGEKIYVDNCAKCHKEDGTGGKSVIEGRNIDADDLTTKAMIEEPDAEYVEYIENGIEDEGMPAFKDVLDESEINEVIKYIRTELQKK